MPSCNQLIWVPTSCLKVLRWARRAQLQSPELLAELNDGVASSYIEEAPSNVIESNPAFFSDFQLVLATQVITSPLRHQIKHSLGFQGCTLTLLVRADEGARPDTA